MTDKNAGPENKSAEKEPDERVNPAVQTGGGAYIGGSVNTGGGDFVGRDKHQTGDIVNGDKITTGDIKDAAGVAIGREARAELSSESSGPINITINDLRGSNQNIKFAIERACRSVSGAAQANHDEALSLTRLLVELNDALQQTPPAQTAAAEQLARTTARLIEAAVGPGDGKTGNKVLWAHVEQMAQELTGATPPVGPLTSEIVAIATNLSARPT